MDLLDKLRAIEKRRETFADASAMPGATVIERVLGPCEVAVGGRPTLMCGSGDVILIDGDSHASIYDATRQTAAQVVAFRHNSPESLRKKLERLPKGPRNRLVVVEGLYSIRGDVAPLRDLVSVAREHGA